MAGKSEEQQKAEMEQKSKHLMADAEVAAAAKMIEAEQKAKQLMADAEVAAAAKMVEAAELKFMIAQAELSNVSKIVEAAELKFMIAQAELSNVSKDVGRVESGKAAACSVVGGVFGALPLLSATSASGSDLSIALSFLAALASCALFGVTYRYAVGRDTSNANLKGGVVAGFALVRAAAAADVLQISPVDGPFTTDVIVSAPIYASLSVPISSVDGPFTTDVIVAASIYAGQSVLLFGFAAAAIEAAFARGLITRCDDAPSRN
eukprot:gene12850-3560_t